MLMAMDVSNLNEHERFKLIRSVEVPENVLNYLKCKLRNLSINILGDYKGNIIDLMSAGLLEGCCWETTVSAIVFLKDNDYVERGNLNFGPSENSFTGVHKQYPHSWISFDFEDKKFIFDPCLQILVEAPIYYHIFEISVKATVRAKRVKDYLIHRIEHSEGETYHIKVDYDNNIYLPMYRNNTTYIATIENGIIKSLIAHYYLCCG